MSNPFPTSRPGMTDPPARFVAITPADADLETFVRGLWIGTGGDVAVLGVGAEGEGDVASVVLKNVPDGYLLLGRFMQVLATGTTASDIVGLI